MAGFGSGAMTLGFPQSVLIPSAAAVVMMAVGMPALRSAWASALAVTVAGLAAWTLVEYVLHRFVLHRLDPFRRWHLEHHREPEAPMRTPVLFSLLPVCAFVALPVLWRTHAGYAALFSCGLIVGQVAQEVVHHRLHRATPPQRGWLAARWRHHHHHHAFDEDAAYGTLTGFWDRLLGTRASPGPR